MRNFLLTICIITGLNTVNAATFTVLNSNDVGAGSFRQAVIDANTLPGLDTVQFDVGTNGNLISLTSGLVDVTDDLLITGNGASNTIIVHVTGFIGVRANSGATLRIHGCGLESTTPSNATVTLDGVNTKLIIEECSLDGNGFNTVGVAPANSSSGDSIIVLNSTFANYNNRGINIQSNPLKYKISNCTFLGSSTGISTGGGHAPVVIENCTFNCNVGAQMGSNDAATFRNNTFTGCNTGLIILSGSITLENNIIYGNTTDVDLNMDFSPPIITASQNIVGSCVPGSMNGTLCPTWFSTANPLLGAAQTCGLQTYFTPGIGSAAIDNGIGGPLTDICGTPYGTADIGSVAAALPPTEALEFDGVDDYINAPALDFSAGNSMTIEAWIKPDDITTNVYYEISRQQSGPIDWLFSFQDNGTILSFGLNTTVGGFTELDVPIIAANFTDGNWHHVAAVYDGANRFVYFDGTLLGSDAKTGNITFGATTHQIGNYPLGAEYFDGDMDEIRFWSCAKTQAEITADMSVDHVGNENGLTLFYDFSDGSGATVTDLSPNGNDGTLANGPVWVAGVATAGAPTFTGCPTDPNHYWVGGAGDWSDAANHWSSTSGGAPGTTTVPTIGNNAIFDDNSGLTALTAVNMDVDAAVDTLNFSAVSNQFVFNGNTNTITIEHSLIGNAPGVTFTGTWGDVIFKPSTVGEIITSGATVWEHNFRMDSTEVMILTDDLDLTTGSMFVDDGGLDLAGFNLSCTQFDAVVANTRTINIAGSDVNVTGGTWDVDPTTLTFTAAGSNILLGDNAGNAFFTGGGLAYDTLRSTSATSLEYYGDNTFSLFAIPTSTTLSINNGETLATDSLIASGTCGTPTTIEAINAGASGIINKTGVPVLYLSGVEVDNVDAFAGPAYNIQLSDTTNGADGWDLAGSTFYWIADGGSWSDANHWSLTSGGVPSGCLPGIPDTVIFDNNSFTTGGETVLVDSLAQFSKMDWSTIAFNATLDLDTNVISYGDVTLNSDLFVTRDSLFHVIQFVDQATFSPDSSLIDCNIVEFQSDAADAVLLTSSLTMTDSTAILIFNGEFYTNDNSIYTGNIQTLNNPGSGTDARLLDLGNSDIHIVQAFNSVGDSALTFNAGGSDIYIGDTLTYQNSLQSDGISFNNVTLNFIPQTTDFPAAGTPIIQKVSGSNTFNKLEVIPGSHVYFEASDTQTIVDSLLMVGNCMDSIYISSTDTASFTASLFDVTSSPFSSVQCTDVSGMTNSGGNVTAYFSTNTTNNTNWTFDTSSPITAGYTADANFCFGDTTLFTNTTTVSPILSNSFTSFWYYNDTSTGYFLNPPTDSTWINYEVDTNAHVFQVAGDISVQMIAMSDDNFCTDTSTQIVHINNPIAALIPSESDTLICLGDSVAFSAIGFSPGMTFEFFLNGVSQNTPSVNDTLYTSTTLTTGDQIGLMGYENGCPVDDTSSITYNVASLPSFTYTASSGPIICAEDSIVFTALPTNVLDTFTYQFLINDTSVAFNEAGTYWTDTLSTGDEVQVVVTDSLFCVNRDTLSFTVNPLPSPVLSGLASGSILCAQDSLTFTGSGADTYEFFVNGVSQGPPGGSTFVTTTLTTGDVVSMIGYSSANCPKDAAETFMYTINPLPIVSMNVSDPDTSICSGTAVTFSASGASEYEFFINDVSQGASSPLSILNTTTLTDEDTIYVIGGFGGCFASSDSAFFEVITSPTTSLASDIGPTICQEDVVTFTANGATNYEFFIDGVSQGAPSVTSTFATDELINGQTVTVEGESNGCIVSQDILFSVLNIPSVGLFSDDPDNTICDQEPITFTGANADSYDLYVNGVLEASQVSPTFVDPTLPVGSNTIYIIGTGANGCADTSATILNVVVNPIPVVNLTSSDIDNIICAGESVTLTGTGSDNYQFLADGSPLSSMSPTSTLTTSTLADGQVLEVVGSSLGCVDTSATITMTVNPIPSVTMTSTDVDNVFCADASVDFTAAGGTNYEFFVDGVSQGAPSATNTINSTGFAVGNYLVEVVGESSNCTNSTSISITVNEVPTASIVSSDLDNIICTGDLVDYTAGTGAVYEFFINGTSQGAPSPLNVLSGPTLANGDVVSVDVFSPAGCINSSTMAAVTVNPTPTVTLASSDIDFQICQGDNVTFTGAGATDYEFLINGVSQGVPSPTNTLSTTGLANGDVIEVIGTSIGCSTTSSNITFTVFGYPIVDLTNNSDTELCVGELTDLVASGAANYQFLVNGVPVGGFSPTATFTNALNNGDIVTVEGETNGCVSTSPASVSYIVYNYPTLASSTNTGTTICLNDLVNFNATGAMTYEFDLNGAIVQSGATSTFDISTLEDGDVMTITGYNGDCASTPDVYTFTVNTMNLDLTVAASSMICDGEAVTFTATGADQYEFFLNGVSQGALSATNTYTSSTLSDLDEVTFVGYNNTTTCTQPFEDYILMNVLASPSIAPQSAVDFCEGDSVVLVSNMGYGNQWYVDGNPIPGATDTSYVAYTSGAYSLETTSGGTGDVWSFGQNATGSFGSGNNFNNSEPTVAATTEQFNQLSSGFDFVLGVTNANEVYAWGENSSGQLGDGTYTSSNLPQIVPTLTNVKNVATTESSSMAVTQTGDVYVWGNNSQGQLATGNTSVINFPFLNVSLANTDSIAGGRNHFVILRNDGTVWAVGNNDYGQLGQGNLTGSMSAVQVPGLAGIVSVGAGEYHSFAIDAAGDLYVWGNNGSGQLGLNDLTNRLDPTLSPVKDVINAQGGANHSVFLTSDEEVWASGGNAFGQLGTGNFTNTTVAVEVPVTGADMISAGQYTTLVKRTDMSVFGFGNNVEDQLSSPSGTSINTPEHISDLDGVVFIEASKSSSHFIYGDDQTCTSANVDVNMLTVPAVTITASGDTLSTIAGASYQWYFNGNPIPGATNQTYVANESGDYEVEVTFANGCTGVSPVYYHSMTSIHDLTFGIIEVYPNPANDVLNVKFGNEINETMSITIYDQYGRLVMNREFIGGSKLSIDVSQLVTGVYHMTIAGSDVSGNIRFVKSSN